MTTTDSAVLHSKRDKKITNEKLKDCISLLELPHEQLAAVENEELNI